MTPIRSLPLRPLLAGALTLAALAAGAPAASAADGSCTAAAKDAMPAGEGHDHQNIGQHGFLCGLEQTAFLPLVKELADEPQAYLGEMDVKGDIAVVAVAFPESGFLVFDVKNPAQPVFKSWYRGSKCEAVVIDIDCGAFVDLSADGKTAYLSVQSLSAVPSAPPDPGVRPASTPGVEVIDISNPAQPLLTQAYVTGPVGGVHAARSFTVPAAGEGARAAGDYVVSVAGGVGLDFARVETVGGKRVLRPYATLEVAEAHDVVVQEDPILKRTLMYVAGGFSTGFEVYDVSDPAAAKFLGRWDPTPECGSDWYAHTMDVRVQDGKRIVTMPAEVFDSGASSAADRAKGCGKVDGNADRPGPLWFVDATDLGRLGQDGDSAATLKQKSADALVTTWTNPADRPGANLLFSPHNQTITGDVVTLSNYHGGLYVLDAKQALAGRPVKPREIGVAVPEGEPTRPLYASPVKPVIPFFTAFALTRGTFWDAVPYKGYVLAPDETGGLYSYKLPDTAG